MDIPDADAATKIVRDKIGILSSRKKQMYPILASVYGNEFDPADHKTLDSIRSMLLEIMHILDASQEGLKMKDFGGHDLTCLSALFA